MLWRDGYGGVCRRAPKVEGCVSGWEEAKSISHINSHCYNTVKNIHKHSLLLYVCLGLKAIFCRYFFLSPTIYDPLPASTPIWLNADIVSHFFGISAFAYYISLSLSFSLFSLTLAHTHTHTHIQFLAFRNTYSDLLANFIK